MLTRRMTVAGGLATGGLAMAACPAQGQAAGAQDMSALAAAAAKEGALTWYTSHTDGETAQLMLDGFMREYPAIKASVVRTTAQVAYQRLLQDIKNGIRQCDVFSSTDLGHDETLRDEGRFVKWTPAAAAALRPEFQNLDPGNTYYPTLAELVVPIYRTDKVTEAQAPKNWPDFLDPRWRNQVTVGHPAFSGTVGTWVVAMKKLYGWSFFEKLEKNKPLIGRSVNDAVGVLTSGERTVGIGPSGLSQVTAARGNPVGIAFPTDGAVLIVSPSAVMKDAPHPAAARLFVEWLLGPAMSKISQDARRLPVRADAPATLNGKDVSTLKIVRLTTAEIVRDMQDVIEQWRDTFGT